MTRAQSPSGVPVPRGGSPDVDVLVVGAGPTGLTLACDLRRRGLAVRVVERLPRPDVKSRGKGVQPRTLEVFDDLGVVDRVLEAGWSRDLRLRWYVQRELLVDLRLPGRDPLPDTPHPNLVLIPQWRTEQVLRERLAELRRAVEWSRELVGLEQDGDGVRASVATSPDVPGRRRRDHPGRLGGGLRRRPQPGPGPAGAGAGGGVARGALPVRRRGGRRAGAGRQRVRVVRRR